MIKGTVLVIIAVKFFSLLGHDVHAWAADLVTRHGIDVGNRYIHQVLEKLTGINDNQLQVFSTVALIYAGLLYVEGVGLWLQKRWAEYLTAISSTLFIPVEMYELYERFTWVRSLVLAVNIFIIWYLFTRLMDEKREKQTIQVLDHMPPAVAKNDAEN